MHTTDAAEAEKTREAPMLWLPPANVKRDLDEKALENFLSCKFPKHANINPDYAELEAKAATDEATKKSKE